MAGGPAADGVVSVSLLGPAWQDGLSTVVGGLSVLDVPLLVLWGAASACGLVLLLAGARALRPVAPALAETGSTLERRIDVMTERPPRRPLLRAAGALAAGALLIAGACELPAPPEPGSVADDPPSAARSGVAAGPQAPSAAGAEPGSADRGLGHPMDHVPDGTVTPETRMQPFGAAARLIGRTKA